MPGRIYIPSQVLGDIRNHIETSVKRAESGYKSHWEDEDAVTGALGERLKTDSKQTVDVTEGNITGLWHWSIDYSKLRGRAQNATESIVGADGILELIVGGRDGDRRKAALFQAKNKQTRDPKLVEQCVKMSVWREAGFIIHYSENGYLVYSIDSILQARGNIAQAKNGLPLASWIMDMFLTCQIGHPSLYYGKDEKRLYWIRRQLSEDEHQSDRWIWTNFLPKHEFGIIIDPPSWISSNAVEISPNNIPLSRLDVTPRDLFGLPDNFTSAELKKRRNELFRAFHTDISNHVSKELKSVLDNLFIEIEEAYRQLSVEAIHTTDKSNKSTNKMAKKPKTPSSLVAPKISVADANFATKNTTRKVKVPKKDK